MQRSVHLCRNCGEAIDSADDVVAARERGEVLTHDGPIPVRGGVVALFHAECAPGDDDPDWQLVPYSPEFA